MKEEFLQKQNVLKAFLYFEDGDKIQRKIQVEIQTVDDKNCYFRSLSSHKFKKTGWFAKAKMVIYTKTGSYVGIDKIREIDFSIEKVLFTIAKPKKWDFVQLRVGERKPTCLPVKIEFKEGLNIETEILDLSIAGFRINMRDDLTNLQMKFPCRCVIEFPDGDRELSAKYVRQTLILDDYEYAGYKAYSFKFVDLLPNQRLALKDYLRTIL